MTRLNIDTYGEGTPNFGIGEAPPFIRTHKKKIVTLLLGGIVAGCGGEDGQTPNQSTPSSPPSGPLQPIILKKMTAELGPISGGTVEFRTMSGKSLTSHKTGENGEFEYNPQDILTKIGNDQWILIQVSGGYDTDVDDNGIRDTAPMPIRGSFRMIVGRSEIEQGKQIIINPRSGLITESLLSRKIPISQEALDHATRENGVYDTNGDGRLSYGDSYSMRMKDVTGVSKILPMSSGYIPAIHSGDTVAKVASILQIARGENHIRARVIPSLDSNSHLPALELVADDPNTEILYTLDLSSPQTGKAGTYTARGRLVIPYQSAKIYYREYSTIGNERVLGKVVGFDLESDWTDLSQSGMDMESVLSALTESQSDTYKNIPYTVTSISYGASPQFPFPKQIGCQVGLTKDAGCHFGPYIAWTKEHEARIRSLIQNAIKNYVDSIPVSISPVAPVSPVSPQAPSPSLGALPNPSPTPPASTPPSPTPPNTSNNPSPNAISLIDTVRSNMIYAGATYTITNTWTQGANNTRTFPVVVALTIQRKNGQIYKPNTTTVSSTSSLNNLNAQLEKDARAYIDNDNAANAPKYTQNQTISYTGGRVSNYYGGYYEVWSTYNLSGTSDFPVRITGIYGTQKNPTAQSPTPIVANTESERISLSNNMVSRLQSIIRADYTAPAQPNYTQNQVVSSGFISYKSSNNITYGYTILSTMNTTGTSDYPATIRVTYTTPLSPNNTTYSLQANTASELTARQNELIAEAKSRIDIALASDQYAPNYVETLRANTAYGGGSYRTTFTYSGNPGQDYPGYVTVHITYRNGSSDTLTRTAESPSLKTTHASSLESQARLQIDNYNPVFSPNQILSDGPYLSGSRGGDYTIKVKYNRVGTNANYPALVWIEFRERTGGPLLDTRNITTIGSRMANSSVEKEQIKTELEQIIRARLSADAGGIFDRIYARSMNIHDLLPISSAIAQTTVSSIRVQRSPTILPLFTKYDRDTTVAQFLGNGSVVPHYVKSTSGRSSIGGKSISDVQRKALEKEALDTYLAVKTALFLRLQGVCTTAATGAGTTINQCLVENQGFLPSANSQSASIKFKIADIIFGSNGSDQMDKFINELLTYKENFLIMYALIIEEQSHLQPPIFEDYIFRDSVGLSQIQLNPGELDRVKFGYTTSTREELMNTHTHLIIMNDRLNKIRQALRRLGKPETAENIGRAWNGGYNCIIGDILCPDAAIAYSKRVKDYAENLRIYFDAFYKK